MLSIHLIKTFNLKAVTYNCRELLSSVHDVKALCKKYNIFLQETWLAKQNLSYLTTTSSTHYAFGISSINESGLLVGRPHVGTAILWNKSHVDVSLVYNDDSTIIGLKLQLDNSVLNFINIYLQYCCPSNTDMFFQYLSKLNIMFESFDNPNLYVVGDFNANDNNLFGDLLKNFCLNHDLIISDQDILPDNSFTYFSHYHGTTSWIDHCLCSFSLHYIISQMEVLHNVITSDHRPLLLLCTLLIYPYLSVLL